MTSPDERKTGPADPITVAFYLPQFHSIPENDAWWGEGFTEWVNVRRAIPLFDGHTQPAYPSGPHGEYSLTDPSVIQWQVELAARNGVDAFCYYHYWFDGKRLLDQPLDQYLTTNLSMPFMICWANENWTRRWDGKEREVLLGQRYDDDTPGAVFESFLPYLRDQRYLRVNGCAVLVVHRADHLPAPGEYARVWRELAKKEGIGELWIIASETSPELDPRRFGFDAVVEFPPVGDSNLRTALTTPPRSLDTAFRGRLLSYERLSSSYVNRPAPDFPRHRGLVPRWDNTPRRMRNSTVVVGSSPRLYARWLSAARASERALRPEGGLVFINAWNEWAEGAYLEPDKQYEDEYLIATRWDYAAEPERVPWRHEKAGMSRAFLHSLALVGVSSARDLLATTRFRIKRGLGRRP